MMGEPKFLIESKTIYVTSFFKFDNINLVINSLMERKHILRMS